MTIYKFTKYYNYLQAYLQKIKKNFTNTKVIKNAKLF